MFFKETFGLVQDTIDPRDVWEDEILGGEDEPLPESYLTQNLPYEPQGSYPYCVSFAATTMMELWYNKETKGEQHKFSQPHLFHNSKGSKTGSSFRENLNTLVKNGAVSYERLPMPDVSTGKPKDWYEKEKERASRVPFEGAKKVGGFVRVQSDPESLKRAVMRYGAVLVGVAAGSGDYYTGNGKRVKNIDNHAVLLVGWDAKYWYIFDSLWWVQKNKGYGTLNRSYTFPSAYAITSLPENWKELRDEKRKGEWENVLNHYGLPANHELEVKIASELLAAVKKSPEASAVAGRFWTVLCNAIAYGGYTYTDIVNDCYHFSKTGKHIFDFNNETREQWKLKTK